MYLALKKKKIDVNCNNNRCLYNMCIRPATV